MRDIKFRAWDSRKKIMVELTLLGLQYRFYDDLTVYGVDLENGNVAKAKENKVPVMQYIGLKDKNGKQIFENDLVEYNENLYQVEWDEETASFLLQGVIIAELESFPIDEEDLLIIGNIYENPELIN
jgi:uncharacterized phage protein (TIGR01671 family)